MLPLLLAYEVAATGGRRNVAEVVASLPLAPIGQGLAVARRTVLAVLAIAATSSLYRSGVGRDNRGLVPRLWRILLEGALAAIVLGPALLLFLRLLGARPEDLGLGRPADAPALAQVAFLAGGAAWEEIVFRIGLQSSSFLLASSVLGFLLESPRFVRAGAEALSLLATSVVFAAAHLAVFTRVLGPGGESFVPAVFTWRLAAGILLGALYRWRGPGVAAWTHALFDAGLAIGAGPDVFL